jgi:hypothetical protein
MAVSSLKQNHFNFVNSFCSCDGRESFPHFTVWSDEAAFQLIYTTNQHNCVYWATEKPNAMEEAVNLPGTSMWCNTSSRGML